MLQAEIQTFPFETTALPVSAFLFFYYSQPSGLQCPETLLIIAYS